MSLMTVQLQAIIKQSRGPDHAGLIIAIDLTEKDDSSRSLYAIDLDTGVHGWYARCDIRSKVRSDVERDKARQKEIAELNAALKAGGPGSSPGPGPGQSPQPVQPARSDGKSDLPDNVREIISGITDALPEPEKHRIKKRKRKPPIGPKES